MSIEQQAASVLLERGVRYKLPAPFFLKMLGKKHRYITIKPLYLGTELRIAYVLESKNISDKKLQKLDPATVLLTYYKDLVKIVAIAWANKKRLSKIELWHRQHLLKKLTVWQIYELFLKIKEISGTAPFLITIRLAVQTKITTPNLIVEKGVGQDYTALGA